MATERIEIIITTVGGKAAGDEIEHIGEKSKLASAGLGLLSGALLAVGAAVGAALSIKAFVDATADAEAGQAQLAAALKSTGAASGQTLDSLNKMAGDLQNITSYEDDAIGKSQALLLTFTQIKGDQFKEAESAVLDLATAMHTDLQGATIQIGKALNNPIQGIVALTRVGVTFTDAQKAMIKGFVETGQAAKAQEVILKELQKEFGGSAEAFRTTLPGALQALQVAFGNLFEVTGPGVSSLTKAINTLTDAMNSDGFKSFAQTVGTLIFDAITVTVQAINGLVQVIPILVRAIEAIGPAMLIAFGPAIYAEVVAFVGVIGTSLKNAFLALEAVIAANPLGAIAIAVTAIIGIVIQFREELGITDESLKKVWDAGVATFQAILNGLSTFWAYAGPVLEKFGSVLYQASAVLLPAIGAAFQSLWSVVKPILDTILAGWQAIYDVITAILGIQGQVTAPNVDIKGAADDLYNKLKSGINDGADAAKPKLTDAVKDGGDKAGTSISTAMTAAAKTAADLQKQALDVGSAALANSFGEGADTIKTGVTDGGTTAADLQKTAITAAGNAMAAQLGATGRNIADLFAQFGNSFIGSFGSIGQSIGDILALHDRAERELLTAQAAANAQAHLANEQTAQLHFNGPTGSSTSTSSSGISSGSSSSSTGSGTGGLTGFGIPGGDQFGQDFSPGWQQRAKAQRDQILLAFPGSTPTFGTVGEFAGKTKKPDAATTNDNGNQTVNVFDMDGVIQAQASAKGRKQQINNVKADRAEYARVLGLPT